MASGNLKDPNYQNGRYLDEIGERHGKLVVLKRVPVPTHLSTKNAYFECQCDCGKTKVIQGRTLRTGNTTSCGCGRIEKISLPPGEAAARRTVDRYKRQAKARGKEWGLKDSEVRDLMSRPCHYCGQEPKNVYKTKARNGDFCYNGIDRKDNTKGYISGNVVPSCWQCNQAKNTTDYNAFLNWAKRISLKHNQYEMN